MNDESNKLMLEHISTTVILKEPKHWTAIITFVSNPGRIHYSSFMRLELNDLVKDPIKSLTMAGFGAICSELKGKNKIEIDQQFYRDNLGIED